MSPEQTRREQAAVVATYREMAATLNAQNAVLSGGPLAPVVAFLEAHQRLAEQALRALDDAERERELSDVRAAYYGYGVHVDYPQDAVWGSR
jgi:hypothetical protein